MSRIVEQCGCGARIEFDKRPAPEYHEQDEVDQEFLRQFRNEHTCPLRASSPENVECRTCRGSGLDGAACEARRHYEQTCSGCVSCPDCPTCGGSGRENVDTPGVSQ